MRERAGDRIGGSGGTIIRLVAGVLALINIETGLWALIDPKGWYANYPGFGHHWVAVQGPFNEHLATDAGAGFLAVGVALLVAAAWANRAAVTVALIASFVHSGPHFAFHVSHHVAGFSAFDTILGVWSLGFEAALALVLLLATRRAGA